MHPAEIWQRSGRWETMGEEMFRLTDRKGARLALAMTHEEIFAVLATELNSHKQLPQAWYQFQTKFRDEPRPRAGPAPGPRVHHEGLLQLRPGPGRAGRRVRPAHARPTCGSSSGWASRPSPWKPPAGPWAAVTRPSSCARRPPARTWSRTARTASTRPTWRRPRPGWPTGGRRPGPGRPGAVRHPRRAHHRGPGHRVRRRPPTRQIKTLVYVLDGKLTLVLMRGDHALNEQKLIDATGAAAIRPGPAGRDPGGARRAARQPGRGRGERLAGHRGRGAARPPGHGHRRQHRRRAPARRRCGPGHRRRARGPTCVRSPAGEPCPGAGTRWSC